MSDMDDDDLFLYGEPETKSTPTPIQTDAPVSESTPALPEVVQAATKDFDPISEVKSPGEPLGEDSEKDSLVGEDDAEPPEPPLNLTIGADDEGEEDVDGDGEPEGEEEEEEEDSEDDVEFIMELPTRSLDFRKRAAGTASTSTPTRPPPQPAPSLTTEYTPRERGSMNKLPPAPLPSSSGLPAASTSTPSITSEARPVGMSADSGPDPSTLPAAIAPPSHPAINPSLPGTLDGRSIFEYDMDALAEKPWRRPGSDISDWFNYGFDEISWEAYCYRRREVAELAAMLKGHVLSFAGMSEDQLTALPPQFRAMVMAGTTAMLAQANGAQNGGGMMPPGAGMNMNGNMMNTMMDMGPMMNMMGMGVVGMSGEMGMGPGMPMGGPGGGGQGMGGGVMPDVAAAAAAAGMVGGMGGAVGMGGQPGAQGGTGTPEQMGMVGDGFGGAGGGGQQMMNMGMGMGGDFGMQEQGMGQQLGPQMVPPMSQQMGQAMGQQMTQQMNQQMNQQMSQQMNPQMFQGMESGGTQGPAPQQPRATPMPQPPFRGRGMPPQMSRGRGAPFAGRGRGGGPLPARPASPLPPNVPTGPRNKNKYKDIDGSAPAVDGLDYGGSGKEGRGTPDYEDRSRKRRSSPGLEDSRGSKRR